MHYVCMFIWLFYCNQALKNYHEIVVFPRAKCEPEAGCLYFEGCGNWSGALLAWRWRRGELRCWWWWWWWFTFWGKQEATARSAPPANLARPGPPKVAWLKLGWALKQAPAAFSPAALLFGVITERSPKVSPRTFNAERGIHAKTDQSVWVVI